MKCYKPTEPEAAISATEKKSYSINTKQLQLSGSTKDTAFSQHTHNLDILWSTNESQGSARFEQLELSASVIDFFFPLFLFEFVHQVKHHFQINSCTFRNTEDWEVALRGIDD